MEKINIAEILKDCPKGMELDCTMYDNCTFNGIEDVGYINILVKTPSGIIRLTKEGCYIRHDDYAKCVIFPKGKTTWEGFQRPFKDGDILTGKTGKPFILKAYLPEIDNVWSYCGIDYTNKFKESSNNWTYAKSVRLATEEEKQKLFDAIKANGYKWNAETKTLEKLITPKFKVGDRIKNKNSGTFDKVIKILEDCYLVEGDLDEQATIDFDIQDNFELVPNKFDISTLIPFESRVLVRNSCDGFWMPTFWGIYEAEKTNRHLYRNYLTTKGFFLHCIPYNDDTKHLMGKTDDCDEYYKTWE